MNKKLTVILLSSLLILFATGCGSTKAPTPVAITQPEGDGSWIEIGRADGDLNKDGLVDRVVVLKQNNERTKLITKNTRRLVVQLQGENEAYSNVLDVKGALMCATCGMQMGDPFESISIENGNFTIAHHGGGLLRWFHSYTFGLVGDDWMMTDEYGYTYDEGKLEETKIEYDWDMGTQTPGETSLEEFDVMLGIL